MSKIATGEEESTGGRPQRRAKQVAQDAMFARNVSKRCMAQGGKPSSDNCNGAAAGAAAAAAAGAAEVRHGSPYPVGTLVLVPVDNLRRKATIVEVLEPGFHGKVKVEYDKDTRVVPTQDCIVIADSVPQKPADQLLEHYKYLCLELPIGSKVVVRKGLGKRKGRFSGMVGTVRDIDIEQDTEEEGQWPTSTFTDHVKVVFVNRGKSRRLSTTKGGTVEVTMTLDQLELWNDSRPAKCGGQAASSSVPPCIEDDSVDYIFPLSKNSLAEFLKPYSELRSDEEFVNRLLFEALDEPPQSGRFNKATLLVHAAKLVALMAMERK